MQASDNIIFAGPVELEQLVHKYIGETEKNLILCDTNTASYCLPIIKNYLPDINDDQLIIIDAGDEEKNITSLHHIWSKMQSHGVYRSNLLINLGGGMITDIGGFAASTYKRGIPFVNIPTSLLGMVDAAIGGKTAINLSKVKNQVGSFKHAEAVIIYPPFLDTLPDEEKRSGYAELVKTALVFNKSLFQQLMKIDSLDFIDDEVIRMAASLKQGVTQKDFLDRAERQCLNFGHSIGHALEALYFSHGKELSHGYAVAAGILCEAYISTRVTKLPPEDFEGIQKHILDGFPTVAFSAQDIHDILALIRHDKKNFDGDIRMSLLSNIGHCKQAIPIPPELIEESLMYYIKHTT